MTSHTPQPPAGDDELVRQAIECDNYPQWLLDLIEAAGEHYASEHEDWSTEQAIAYAVLRDRAVTKSSYDALAAAKARSDWRVDAMTRVADGDEEEINALRTRAESAERQRDALRELLDDALDEHDTSHGEITDPDDPHWSVRARAIKDEGSAT